jgi:hypothetical protein
MPNTDPAKRNAWMRAWRKKNRARATEIERNWRKKNPEKYKAQKAAQVARDPEKEKRRQAAKYQRNKEHYLKYNRDYLKANPEKRREYEARKKIANPQRFKEQRRRLHRRKMSEKVALAGRPRPDHCELCGRKGPIYWDHDHVTGLFRGWLCRGCNTSLGMMMDNPVWLRRLADYVERFQCQMVA